MVPVFKNNRYYMKPDTASSPLTAEGSLKTKNNK